MAPKTTDYSEIQQNEIEALRSIYMEDFKEDAVKTGAWNVGCNTFKGCNLHESPQTGFNCLVLALGQSLSHLMFGGRHLFPGFNPLSPYEGEG